MWREFRGTVTSETEQDGVSDSRELNLSVKRREGSGKRG